MASDRILFLGTYPDKSYLSYLKGCAGSATVAVSLKTAANKTALKMFCQKHHITQVVSTQVPLLEKLLNWEKRKKPSLANYAGSHFWLDVDKTIEVIFIPPLQQLVTVPYGKFLTKRLLTKFTQRSKWWEPTAFSWTELKPSNIDQLLPAFEEAQYIAVDIETFKENASIRCVSYTSFYIRHDTITSNTVVLPMESQWAVDMMRKFNALPAQKILQNGKYDIAYMTRYHCPLYNYAWDTAALFHAWLSELPKDLGFLNAFLLREAMYWKDLAETTDREEYFRYNALDTWGTGNAFFAMMLEYPDYAMTNYALEFPQQFPCHLAEMTGIKRDPDRLQQARAEQDEIIAEKLAELNIILGTQNFNVMSNPQMMQLLKILGCKDLKSANEMNLEKARYRHPLNAYILQLVIDIRKARKLVSTYLKTGESASEFKGRILYALNPHGTDTSRLASASHHFWCGFNIQNQPRGREVKQTYKADPGFVFAEVDLAQAETYDTAYISGDKALLAAVESTRDFHSGNVERFFGIPYDKVYSDADGKILDKQTRDLGKRVNHGANYNMGPPVLIDTMGLEKIFYAKRVLGLPIFYTAKQVAEHLLEVCYHGAYPDIRAVYHAGILKEVIETGYIVSRAAHYCNSVDQYEQTIAAGAWTRRTFGDPNKAKHIRNSYIAHGPQSLNAQTLNKAWLRVFKDIAINPKHAPNFKLCAQIHDSILFQFRIGHDYLPEMVRERMEIPVTIRGYDDVVRTFCVPADIKAGPNGKGATYWSETE